MMPRAPSRGTLQNGRAPDDRDGVTDAVLSASRVLVAVAARSIGELAEDVTLPQYRAMVVLSTRGPQRPGDLAEALSMSPSTATRLCDRLERKRLIYRDRQPEGDDRRAVRVGLSRKGAELVDEVTRYRRREIRGIVGRLTEADRGRVVSAFRAFAVAAGEPVDESSPAGRWAL